MGTRALILLLFCLTANAQFVWGPRKINPMTGITAFYRFEGTNSGNLTSNATPDSLDYSSVTKMAYCRGISHNMFNDAGQNGACFLQSKSAADLTTFISTNSSFYYDSNSTFTVCFWFKMSNTMMDHQLIVSSNNTYQADLSSGTFRWLIATQGVAMKGITYSIKPGTNVWSFAVVYHHPNPPIGSVIGARMITPWNQTGGMEMVARGASFTQPSKGFIMGHAASALGTRKPGCSRR